MYQGDGEFDTFFRSSYDDEANRWKFGQLSDSSTFLQNGNENLVPGSWGRFSMIIFCFENATFRKRCDSVPCLKQHQHQQYDFGDCFTYVSNSPSPLYNNWAYLKKSAYQDSFFSVPLLHANLTLAWCKTIWCTPKDTISNFPPLRYSPWYILTSPFCSYICCTFINRRIYFIEIYSQIQ